MDKPVQLPKYGVSRPIAESTPPHFLRDIRGGKIEPVEPDQLGHRILVPPMLVAGGRLRRFCRSIFARRSSWGAPGSTARPWPIAACGQSVCRTPRTVAPSCPPTLVVMTLFERPDSRLGLY